MTKNFNAVIGCSFGFTFEITNLDAIDEAYFVIRENEFDDEPVLIKTIEDMQRIADNKYRVTLTKSETVQLMPLNYLYGLEIGYGTNSKLALEGKLLVDINPARRDNGQYQY